MVAMLPDDYATARRLIDAHSLGEFTLVPNMPVSTYRATGTPTLIEVDQLGVVEHVWVGALAPDRQAEVMKALYHGG
jgi:hypothetical protein